MTGLHSEASAWRWTHSSCKATKLPGFDLEGQYVQQWLPQSTMGIRGPIFGQGTGRVTDLAIIVQDVVLAGRCAVRQHPAGVLPAIASKQHRHTPADRRGACSASGRHICHAVATSGNAELLRGLGVVSNECAELPQLVCKQHHKASTCGRLGNGGLRLQAQRQVRHHIQGADAYHRRLHCHAHP